jgi:UDPglucose 6-dehydrogenase
MKGKPIAVLGLAFKPNTDDIRFSPAIDLIHDLLAEGANVRAFDPEAMEKARAVLPQVKMSESPYEAAKDAEALIIATEWKQFRELDWRRMHDQMMHPMIVDARNLLLGPEMKALGFEYYSIGRPD